VQQVAVVAHEAVTVDNRIVNHWATYLVTGEDESIRLDMTPGGVYDKDVCHLGVLLVEELNYKYSRNYSKVVELEISRPVAANRGAQTAFILFSTFLDLRPVSAASYSQTSIYGTLVVNSDIQLKNARLSRPNGFLDVLLARNYDRYIFTASGVGCRFWTTEAVTAFEEEDLLVRGSTDAVREVMKHGWEAGGMVSSMDRISNSKTPA
jgi:hypothetical protein